MSPGMILMTSCHLQTDTVSKPPTQQCLLSNIHTKMLMFLISVSSLPATDLSVQGDGSRRSSDSAITQQ